MKRAEAISDVFDIVLWDQPHFPVQVSLEPARLQRRPNWNISQSCHICEIGQIFIFTKKTVEFASIADPDLDPGFSCPIFFSLNYIVGKIHFGLQKSYPKALKPTNLDADCRSTTLVTANWMCWSVNSTRKKNQIKRKFFVEREIFEKK